VNLAVRRLSGDDVAAYRDIRLEGLVAEPAMFGASFEEDSALGDGDWRAALGRNFTFGAFEGPALGGVASYSIEGGTKVKHRGHLFGVYVRPQYRGTGVARLLLEALIASARTNVRFLYLQVTQESTRAVRFYERMGFVIYGNDPGGLFVDGTLYQDYLMMLRLDEGSAESDRK